MPGSSRSGPAFPLGGDDALAERVHDLGPLEHARDLAVSQAGLPGRYWYSRMSCSGRPAACSRTTYAATRSSLASSG